MRPGSLHLFALTVLCAVAGVACNVTDPNVVVPVGTQDAGPPVVSYADQVVTALSGGMLISCGQDFPDCAQNTAQDPACPGDAFRVLGRPDGVTFDVGPNDRLVLGFYCGQITEVGGAVEATYDFYVYASVDGGPMPVVEVSLDAENYEALNMWQLLPADQSGVLRAGFQLEKAGLTVVRYVRIANAAGTGIIHVDAVEALRSITRSSP